MFHPDKHRYIAQFRIDPFQQPRDSRTCWYECAKAMNAKVRERLVANGYPFERELDHHPISNPAFVMEFVERRRTVPTRWVGGRLVGAHEVVGSGVHDLGSFLQYANMESRRVGRNVREIGTLLSTYGPLFYEARVGGARHAVLISGVAIDLHGNGHIAFIDPAEGREGSLPPTRFFRRYRPAKRGIGNRVLVNFVSPSSYQLPAGKQLGADVEYQRRDRPEFMRWRASFAVDTDGDGRPDAFPKVVRRFGRFGGLGYDLDGDGRPDFFPDVRVDHGKVGYDLDGDGRPDFFPPVVRSGTRVGFDVDGDGKPDVLPTQLRVGELSGVGFDLDGDGKPDFFPRVVGPAMRRGFDLDGDGKPDYLPPVVRHAGRTGFDLDGDGKPDFIFSAPLGRLGTTGRIGAMSSTDIDRNGIPDWLERPVAGVAVVQDDLNRNGIPDYLEKAPPRGGIDGNPNTPW